MKHEEVRQTFKWGTFGKNGNEPLKYIILKDISNEHLNNILSFVCDNITHYGVHIYNTILAEIVYRRLNNIFVPEYTKNISLFKFSKN